MLIGELSDNDYIELYRYLYPFQEDPLGNPQTADKKDGEEEVDDDDGAGHRAEIRLHTPEEGNKKEVGDEVGFDDLFETVQGKEAPGCVIDVKIKKCNGL